MTDVFGNATILNEGCLVHVSNRHPDAALFYKRALTAVEKPDIVIQDKKALLFYQELSDDFRRITGQGDKYIVACTLKGSKKSDKWYMTTFYFTNQIKRGNKIYGKSDT